MHGWWCMVVHGDGAWVWGLHKCTDAMHHPCMARLARHPTTQSRPPNLYPIGLHDTAALVLTSLVSYQLEFCKCGGPYHEKKIIRGHVVAPHSIPYQVGITNGSENIFCGGALISPNYVLTGFVTSCITVLYKVYIQP